MASKTLKKRIVITLFFGVFFFVLLMGRLSWLQLVRGEELSKLASDVRIKDEILTPMRGIVYDRNHNELVGSVKVNSVYANPDFIEEPEVAAEKVSSILGLNREETLKKFTSGQPFVWLKHRVDVETCKKLKELEIGGLGYVDGSRRSYRQPGLAAHLLGFVGDDNQGLNGIEKSFDRELRGVPGRLVIEADAAGRQLPQTRSHYIPPVPGNNLVLTLDQSIQFFVERELDKVVAEYKPSRAVILVADPKTGEMLAMGTRPSFDPANWKNYPQSVWDKNPATLYNYEPGSTFKTMTAAAALEEGVVRENDRFYDPGYITVKGRKIHCWDRAGHKDETFAEGVMNSCNPVYIQVGLKLGKEKMYKYINGFGFGQPTGIELPGEESGVVKRKEEATELDLATISIGQTNSVTPVQLLRATCAVANGGYLPKLTLVKSVEDIDGKTVKKFEPETIRQVISSETSRQVRNLLERVVLEGTGKSAYVEGYRVAGKTGTAQVPGERGGYAQDKYIASFAGFAPADDPRVVILVVIAEPRGDKYYGSEVAAPVFQAVARDTLRYLRIPENPNLPAPKNSKEVKEPAPVVIKETKHPVPNVVGFPLDEALQAIKEAGFNPGVSGKNGFVSEQKPAGGSMLTPGATVNLTVSPLSGDKPPEQVLVPDVRGMTLKKAGTLLEEVGLVINSTGSGLAVKQTPAPGIKAVRGSKVTVEFKSTGP